MIYYSVLNTSSARADVYTQSVWVVSASSKQLQRRARANMPRKLDKARRAIASNAQKTRELIAAIKNSDRILARDLIFRDNVPIPKLAWQEYTSFLRTAVKSRDTPLVRKLLGTRSSLDGTVGAELLWEVIDEADTRTAEMLVRAGADVNKSLDGDSTSLLHVLAQSNDRRKFELAVTMVKCGANVKARDVKYDSVLQVAIAWDNLALAGELLRRGAEVDVDVLWEVVDSRSPVQSLLLIVNGDHLRHPSARTWLIANVFKELCTFDFDERKLVDMTRAMFDLEIPPVQTILQAVRHRRIGVMESLLRRADIDDSAKKTFLHVAVSDPHTSRMARVLVEWGADIEHPVHLELGIHNQGIRPLHAACRHEALENIELLLQLGADVNARDSRGNTPFSCTNSDDLSPANVLVIKHFALLTSRGVTINQDDLGRIAFAPILQKFFDDCLQELREMRGLNLFGRITFYSILTDAARSLVVFVRRRRFLNAFEDNVDFFPVYLYELHLRLREAQRLRALLVPKEEAVSEALREIVPDVPLEEILHYMCLNEAETLTDGPLLGP